MLYSSVLKTWSLISSGIPMVSALILPVTEICLTFSPYFDADSRSSEFLIVNAFLQRIVPLYRWFKKELVKVDILGIVEERRSDMDNVIEIMLFERVVPSASFRVIRDNRERKLVSPFRMDRQNLLTFLGTTHRTDNRMSFLTIQLRSRQGGIPQSIL